MVGIKLETIPEYFTTDKKVGDLSYFDGPLISVFADSEKNPLIYYWVDVQSSMNRWVIFKVSFINLKLYLTKQLSFRSLLEDCVDRNLLLLDLNDELKPTNIFLTHPQSLSKEYKPSVNSFFDVNSAPELAKIIEFFELEDIDNPDSVYNENLLIHSKSLKSEILNIHVNSDSENVGFGKIDATVLGKILIDYQAISENVALRLYAKQNASKVEKDRIKEFGRNELYLSKAASFDIYLKPKKNEIDLFSESRSERIVQQIFDLFGNSDNSEKLREIKERYSDNILNHFLQLLEHIRYFDLDISFGWSNYKKKMTMTSKFDYKSATRSIEQIKNLEYDREIELKAKGRYYALDRKNNSFKFKTNKDEDIIGKFSAEMKDGISNFNLLNFYKITYKQFEKKEYGKIEPRIKNVIIGCMLDEDNLEKFF